MKNINNVRLSNGRECVTDRKVRALSGLSLELFDHCLSESTVTDKSIRPRSHCTNIVAYAILLKFR